ncbi:hypothetical protein EJ05DRAFT_271279 [Pseudovirgaria hyperparasitica]|uniref:Uncharacterized protein n=1 Tax=Pseudovirgaria hyperparasitica TaxID=470096 RepID=A0A6A6WDM1_9PEZI|nr:uncharacterized protein EJ05DRAFT_271279 [Pseudovirgaria hyperparasitica]KAF2760070.1 hypothetical protein EJ05DRAFT_271279 [Pseudovirgaria hyperparasitica]
MRSDADIIKYRDMLTNIGKYAISSRLDDIKEALNAISVKNAMLRSSIQTDTPSLEAGNTPSASVSETLGQPMHDLAPPVDVSDVDSESKKRRVGEL